MHSIFRLFPAGRVGSSILASLSEAGGDVLLRLASKPLPPRSLSSANVTWNAPMLLTLQITRQSRPTFGVGTSRLKSADSPITPQWRRIINPKRDRPGPHGIPPREIHKYL